MQTSKRQGEGKSTADTASDTRNVSKIKVWLTPSQCEFIDFVLFYGASELSKSLRIVHDLALYHSDVPIGAEEKRALFGVRCLGKKLKKPL
ncbi:hypothetical protein MH928_07490 [Flavobacterium sp. WW92]|uniref:hypothetical protein n=1 Tax=unclassified Flavobacterium TaxID=196869 RepID=UPI002223EF83|nr:MULTISPECIES: hypothetical protein [unclassified Flavobacterium]WDO14530.1 hypothetical protein MH928_07490 [Flavobacterium sp. WW92]